MFGQDLQTLIYVSRDNTRPIFRLKGGNLFYGRNSRRGRSDILQSARRLAHQSSGDG